EQLLSFLIPELNRSELSVYLSAPPTPLLLSDSNLIHSLDNTTKNSTPTISTSRSSSCSNLLASPVCAAAAAVALTHSNSFKNAAQQASNQYDVNNTNNDISINKKRCSTYAFLGDDEEFDLEKDDDEYKNPVFVMSCRNTRKRLMLEQPFIVPDEDDIDISAYTSTSNTSTNALVQQEIPAILSSPTESCISSTIDNQ